MTEQKPNPTPPPADDQAPTLAGLTGKTMAKWKKVDLVRLCKKLGLAAEGTKAKLIPRILAKQAGGDRGVVHGKTICPYCGELATVTSTDGTPLADGRRMVRRSMKCKGRRCHRWTDKSVEGKSITAAG